MGVHAYVPVSLCVCMHVSACMHASVCMYVSTYPCSKNACIYTNMQVPSLAADIQAAGGGASALFCACGIAAARAPFSVVGYLISVPWSTYFIVWQYISMWLCGGCACLSVCGQVGGGGYACLYACMYVRMYACIRYTYARKHARLHTHALFVQPTATHTHQHISILFKHVGPRTSFSSRANPFLDLQGPPQSSVSADGEDG